jgi:hypothetical protein
MEIKTPVVVEEPAALADEEGRLELEPSLTRLRNMVVDGDINEAREFVKELEKRWPDSDRVQYWARVLAPAKVTVRHGERSRSTDQERTWLLKNAAKYPGCWLAVFGDRLVAVDPDLGVVLDTVRQTPGAESAVLFFQPARE